MSPPKVDGALTRERRSILRRATLSLTLVGFVCALATPSGRVTPILIQAFVILAVLTFAFVGFWMLQWPEPRTNTLGRIFCWGGLLGAFVYLAATYANLASTKDLPGGVIVGWSADMLFFPSIAILSTLFLLSIPTEGWRNLEHVHAVIAGSVVAAVLVLAGMFLEPRLLIFPDADAPAAGSSLAHLRTALFALGLAVFSGTMLFGLAKIRTLESVRNVVKWYEYGGLLALLALVPYCWLAIVPGDVPQEHTMFRAGLAAVALVAIAAIPATVGEPWRSVRMKRLLRGALIAAFAAAIHEWMVSHTVESMTRDPGVQPELGGQVVFTYELTLLFAAVLFEPLARGFDQVIERIFHWRSPPHDILEEALYDFRTSTRELNQAIARAGRVRSKGGAAADDAGRRVENHTKQITDILADIRLESHEIHTLTDQIESELPSRGERPPHAFKPARHGERPSQPS